ncbi:hypothetical protein EDB82DRAFT_493423 [Fusarium venenatum]|uniref:uncharacterized protein n=1 Tax=Fusarium venenatum TaxID=56646 RepID=UPI001D88AE29|nr:hypothetical protein EDB82DRAFT_493423 [Fusarium venenatum]
MSGASSAISLLFLPTCLSSLAVNVVAPKSPEIPSNKGVLSLRGIRGPTPRNPEPALSGTGTLDWIYEGSK